MKIGKNSGSLKWILLLVAVVVGLPRNYEQLVQNDITDCRDSVSNSLKGLPSENIVMNFDKANQEITLVKEGHFDTKIKYYKNEIGEYIVQIRLHDFRYPGFEKIDAIILNPLDLQKDAAGDDPSSRPKPEDHKCAEMLTNLRSFPFSTNLIFKPLHEIKMAFISGLDSSEIGFTCTECEKFPHKAELNHENQEETPDELNDGSSNEATLAKSIFEEENRSNNGGQMVNLVTLDGKQLGYVVFSNKSFILIEATAHILGQQIIRVFTSNMFDEINDKFIQEIEENIRDIVVSVSDYQASITDVLHQFGCVVELDSLTNESNILSMNLINKSKVVDNFILNEEYNAQENEGSQLDENSSYDGESEGEDIDHNEPPKELETELEHEREPEHESEIEHSQEEKNHSESASGLINESEFNHEEEPSKSKNKETVNENLITDKASPSKIDENSYSPTSSTSSNISNKLRKLNDIAKSMLSDNEKLKKHFKEKMIKTHNMHRKLATSLNQRSNFILPTYFIGRLAVSDNSPIALEEKIFKFPKIYSGNRDLFLSKRPTRKLKLSEIDDQKCPFRDLNVRFNDINISNFSYIQFMLKTTESLDQPLILEYFLKHTSKDELSIKLHHLLKMFAKSLILLREDKNHSESKKGEEKELTLENFEHLTNDIFKSKEITAEPTWTFKGESADCSIDGRKVLHISSIKTKDSHVFKIVFSSSKDSSLYTNLTNELMVDSTESDFQLDMFKLHLEEYLKLNSFSKEQI
jgi:hypothetical protein